MMTIYCKAGAAVATITPSDQSTRIRTTTRATISLIFQYPGSLSIPVGSYIIHDGTRYTLRRPAIFIKNGERDYQYTLELISQPGPDKYRVKDVTTKRLKFSLTARPEEFLQMIVDNLNERESGWEVGDYLSAKERLVQFNHNTITEALTAIAEAFSTEYEIVGKTISLRKIEYNKANPVALSYGGDYGFQTGVRRENYEQSIPIEILHVQGGDRNITLSTYGAKELLLPKSQTIGYDGAKFQDEDGFQGSLARTYITDTDGLTIRRQDKALNTMEESSLDLSDIYPSRVGTITTVVEVDAEDNLFDIIDTGIPADLDFDDCLIPGETMTIKFQSGMLVGQEFECNYSHPTRRFEIIPQEIDGQTMPNTVYAPVAGDEYIILGIQLPDAYISNDSTLSGASWDLFREAVRHLYENEDDRFTFTGELDPVWYREQYLSIGSRIVPGGYISFSDTQFQPTPVLIRIASVKDHLNDPYDCTLDLSNVAVGAGSVRNELVKLTTGEVKAKDDTQDSVRFFKRRFRDASETMAMLQAGILNYSGAINPVAIQTMQLIAGDQALQFRFVNSKTTPVKHAFTANYDTGTRVFSSSADILQHMTVGITTVSAARTVTEYRFWDIAAFTSTALSDPTKAFWVYAKCSAEGTTGSIFMSETPIAINDVANYYHFLIGILNSEYDNDRSFVPLHGFTEILPGQITTDRLQSEDGTMFVDLQGSGAARLGSASSYADFNNETPGTLVLRNVKIKSLSGTSYNIIIDRGAWNSAGVYFPGEVTQDEGSSWISLTSNNKNNKPSTSPLHWKIQAAKGADGNSVTLKSAVPTVGDLPTSGNSLGDARKVLADGHLYACTALPATWEDYGPFQGPKGDAGDAAKYVRITGPTEFVLRNHVYTPASVTLTAHLFNLQEDYQWQYYASGTGWTDLAGQTEQTTTITPDNILIWGSAAATLRIRCLSNTDYYDEITISRLADGDGAANVVLTQESRAIACAADGTPKAGQLPFDVTVKTMIGANLLDNDGNTWSSDGLTYTLSGDNDGTTIITVTAVSALSAYIEMSFMMIPPTGNGVEITKRFTVNKILDGAEGATGPRGASAVTRGTYRADKTYIGNANRRDVVRYYTAGAWGWFIAKATAGSIINVLPTNTEYWEPAGAEFESIATDLLLATGANIAGFIFIQDAEDETTGTLITQAGFAYNSTTGSWYETTDIDANLFEPRVSISAATKSIKVNSIINKYTGEGLTYNTIACLTMDNTAGKIRAYEPYNTGEGYLSSKGARQNTAGIMEEFIDDNGVSRKILAANIVNTPTTIGRRHADAVAAYFGRAGEGTGSDAPSFGGYFHALMAVGLHLKPLVVNNSATPIQITREHSWISCYNTTAVTINLPTMPNLGQQIICKKNGTGNMIIDAGPSKQILRNTAARSLNIAETGRAVTLLWDGIYWNALIHTI